MQAAKHIYVMESEIGLIKLGIANDPASRLKTIQGATGIRLALAHATEARRDARAVEAAAHKLLAEKRKTGEWFDVSPDEAIRAIEDATALIEESREPKEIEDYGFHWIPGQVMSGEDAIKLIHSLGLTQADAARVVGISATAVQKWRTGGALHGSTETLLLLLKERPEMIGVIKRMRGLE